MENADDIIHWVSILNGIQLGLQLSKKQKYREIHGSKYVNVYRVTLCLVVELQVFSSPFYLFPKSSIIWSPMLINYLNVKIRQSGIVFDGRIMRVLLFILTISQITYNMESHVNKLFECKSKIKSLKKYR